MHTIDLPLVLKIVQRTDLRTAKSVEVNVRWRDDKVALAYVAKVGEYLSDLGFKDIDLSTRYESRFAAIIVGTIYYKVELSRNSTLVERLLELQHLQRQVTDVHRWWDENCIEEPLLDERGLTFLNDDDYLLYKLRFL
jgi:hypothetical protein